MRKLPAFTAAVALALVPILLVPVTAQALQPIPQIPSPSPVVQPWNAIATPDGRTFVSDPDYDRPRIGTSKVGTVAKSVGWSVVISAGLTGALTLTDQWIAEYCSTLANGSTPLEQQPGSWLVPMCGDLEGYVDQGGLAIDSSGVIPGQFLTAGESTPIGSPSDPCRFNLFSNSSTIPTRINSSISLISAGSQCDANSSPQAQIVGSPVVSGSNITATIFCQSGSSHPNACQSTGSLLRPTVALVCSNGVANSTTSGTGSLFQLVSGSNSYARSCPSPHTPVGLLLSGSNFDYPSAPFFSSSSPRVVWGIWTLGFVPPSGGEVPGTLTTTVTCTDGTTTTSVSLSADRNLEQGGTAEIPAPQCPTGFYPTGTDLDWVPDVGTPTEVVTSSPDDVPSPLIPFIEDHPECFDGTQTCELELWQRVGDRIQTCGPTGNLCPDWARDPYAPSTYVCKFNGVEVDLNYCSAYRAPTIGVLPNVDSDGVVIPYTSPPPIPGPTGVPQISTLDSPQNCSPPSFFDGLTNLPYWIWQGMLCALADAFVPNPTVVQTHTQTIINALNASPAGTLAIFISDLNQSLPELDGCSGPPVNFDIQLMDMNLVYEGYPLSACEPPMDGLAAAARLLGSIAMSVSAVYAATRYIGGIFGFQGFGKGASG